MKLKLILVLACVGVLWVALGAQSIDPASLPLLTSASLKYAGAFRLPAGPFGTSSFAYGGSALTFNPAKPSLFLVGHAWQQEVAEISIPALITSTSAAALNEATVLQPFADPLEGRRTLISPNDPAGVWVGGLLVDGDKLYGTHYIYYDGSGSQTLSHWVRSTTLSQASVQGPYAIGGVTAGQVSGYLARIPSVWQALLGGPVLNGQCCIPILSRTSFGPGAFALDVTKIAAPQTPASLVFYPQAHPLSQWDATSTLFNGSTHIAGVIFPEGSGSVLWIGRQGLGTYCYGFGTAQQPVPPPAADGTGYCYDPTDDSKGNHSYPAAYQVWAYRATDFAAVKAGSKQSWEIQPAATWTFTLPIPSWKTWLEGATYDPASQRLYVSQAFGDGDRPVIHAFDLTLDPVVTSPPPIDPVPPIDPPPPSPPVPPPPPASVCVSDPLRVTKIRWPSADTWTGSLGIQFSVYPQHRTTYTYTTSLLGGSVSVTDTRGCTVTVNR